MYITKVSKTVKNGRDFDLEFRQKMESRKLPSNKSKFLAGFQVKYVIYHRMHTASWEDQPGGGDALEVVDWRSRTDVHEFLESLAKLGVEDGVYHRVDKAVHVAKPGGDDEGRQRGLARRSELGADRVHHVACEERHPAEQEHTCKQSKERSVNYDEDSWRMKRYELTFVPKWVSDRKIFKVTYISNWLGFATLKHSHI